MAEYIEREALIKRLKANKKWSGSPSTMDYAIELAKTIRTTDVVEVVRCKDCAYCELRYPAKAINEEAIEGYFCYLNQRYLNPTDFCSYGQRKTN